MREQWAQEAYRRLSVAGHRAGGAREQVIELLAREGGCMTAAEVVARLTAEGRSAAYASVYRTLATLRELGLVRAFDHGEGVLRYELEDPTGAHHHHLVCEHCGSTQPFENDDLERAIELAARDRGYQLVAHEVVLYGRCVACAGKA